jgi:Protein of unknown function (DUF3306)
MSERDGETFLSRWSRRKALVREGREVRPEPTAPTLPSGPAPGVAGPAAATVAVPAAGTAAPTGTTASAGADTVPARPAPPTLEDAARLEPGAEVTRFVAPDVDPQVRNAALKKLFADPHYNVMDGLDVYIDDYGKPDPIPASMLRQMVQSHALGLFDDEKDKEPAAVATPARQPDAAGERADPDGKATAAAAPSPDDPSPETLPNDPDTAVRLQPDDAAGPSGPGEGAGGDTGRQR